MWEPGGGNGKWDRMRTTFWQKGLIPEGFEVSHISIAMAAPQDGLVVKNQLDWRPKIEREKRVLKLGIVG